MILPDFLPSKVRGAWIAKREIALIDLRTEASFAQGHPIFASQIPVDRLEIEAPLRIPRLATTIVLYDAGEGLVDDAARTLAALGYSCVGKSAGGLKGWSEAGYELFEDVNSYCKAFGELVESRKHTPSLSPQEVKALIDCGENMVILDARRFDEYQTMAIPGGVSVPGAELVLRARELAPDPKTKIIVNCAGRTRSLIGAQSLINAKIPNPVNALRNGTIGWTLAGQALAHEQGQRYRDVAPDVLRNAQADARDVSYRAGVRRIDAALLADISGEERTLYRFDVRPPEEYAVGHIPGFINVPGGQLVQETDMVAPVRGARIVLADDLLVRADMSASWLAQMGWEVYVLEGGFDGELETGDDRALPARGKEGKYKRPYEGTDNPHQAMQAYLDWEFGLVRQLANDASHGFYVI